MSNLYNSNSILTEVGLDITQIISIYPPHRRSQYRAVINWLSKYQPNPNASHLEKVKGLLEAFYHLSELEEWKKAYQIISYSLNTYNQEKLHNQLQIWGYYREEINLYHTLRDNLDREANYLCLKGLANAHQNLAEYEQAIDYLQKSLSVAEQINDPIKQANALNNLGAIHGKLRNWKEAFNYLKISLKIIENNNALSFQNTREKQRIEADILGNFGNIYGNQRKFNEARKYLEKSLSIAQEIGDRRIESIVINNLANLYVYRKDYDLALSYFEKSLQFALASENAYLQQQAYNNLGNLSKFKKDFNMAVKFLKKSLKIARDTGNREGETIVLENLGTVYANQANYREAIKYFEHSLNLAITIGDKQGIFLGRINLSLAHLFYFWKNLFKNSK
jgi:tetratricopeptide (TPR) repeat protein